MDEMQIVIAEIDHERKRPAVGFLRYLHGLRNFNYLIRLLEYKNAVDAIASDELTRIIMPGIPSKGHFWIRIARESRLCGVTSYAIPDSMPLSERWNVIYL